MSASVDPEGVIRHDERSVQLPTSNSQHPTAETRRLEEIEDHEGFWEPAIAIPEHVGADLEVGPEPEKRVPESPWAIRISYPSGHVLLCGVPV
jgi:hypothetical protein